MRPEFLEPNFADDRTRDGRLIVRDRTHGRLILLCFWPVAWILHLSAQPTPKFFKHIQKHDGNDCSNPVSKSHGSSVADTLL
jgi:hypothetical protein